MSINYRKSHSIRIAFLNIFFPEIKLNCFIARSVCALVFCALLKRIEMKSWLLGYCKLMGQCRHAWDNGTMPGDCPFCWSTGQASALIIHFWCHLLLLMILSTSAILLIPSFPESLPHYLYSLLKSRRFSLSNPSLISYFLHGNACHNLFLLHNVHPPHTTRATTNPPLPSAFMPL